MKNTSKSDKLDQLKLNLYILKNKIAIAQDFLNQVQQQAYHLQEFIFDEEDKMQEYVNKL